MPGDRISRAWPASGRDGGERLSFALAFKAAAPLQVERSSRADRPTKSSTAEQRADVGGVDPLAAMAQYLSTPAN